MKIAQTYYKFNLDKSLLSIRRQCPAFCSNKQDKFEMSIGYVNDIHGQTNNMLRILSGIKGDLRLSSGDINTGNKNSKKNNLVGIEFMNLAQIRATTIGNHEMDTSQGDLSDTLKHYRGDVLVANMHKLPNWQNKKDNLAEYDRIDLDKKFVKSSIVKIKGEKIGLIGVMPTDLQTRISYPQYHTDCIVDDIDTTIKDVQGETNKLKAQKVNKIFLLSHLGLENDKKVAKQTDGIDVIIGGHTHEVIRDIKEGENLFYSKSNEPVILTQAGKNGNYFGLLNLTFDENGVITKAQNNLGESKLFRKNLINQYLFEKIIGKSELVGYIEEVLPATSSKLQENPHVNFVCDAMREESGADIAIWQVSGIRGAFQVGDIDSSEVKELSPFGAELGLINLSEAVIVDAFNYAIKESYNAKDNRPGILGISGLEYTIDRTNKKLAAMNFIDKDGHKIAIDIENPRKDKTYKVIADNYFLFAGADYLKLAEPDDCIKIFPEGKDDMTCQYIKKLNKPIVINQIGRINYVD